MSVRTTTPRLTASASARSTAGYVRRKMYRSIEDFAPSIAARSGATPSSGWTRSFIRTLLLLLGCFPLDGQLDLPLLAHRHERVADPIGAPADRQLDVVSELFLAERAAFERHAEIAQDALDLGPVLTDVLARDLERKPLLRVRLERLEAPEERQDEGGRTHRDAIDADTGGEADGERDQHDGGVLRIVDLGAIADEIGGAENAEGPCKAGTDHQHDDRSDDRQDDLGLDDGGIPWRRPAPHRPEGERRTKDRRQGHGDQGIAPRLRLVVAERRRLGGVAGHLGHARAGGG